LVSFAKSLRDTKVAIDKKAEEDAKKAKLEEEKAKKAAAIAAKKAAGAPSGGDATGVVLDDSKSVFEAYNKSMEGNSDDIVNKLRMRHAAGKDKEPAKAADVNNELFAKLAMRKK
jgi:hypothetical protein